jgi:hypothetical protein
MTITLSVPKTESAVALRLRPWRLDDLPALLTAHRDPVLRRWLATSLADETDAQQWLDAQAAGWASTTRFSFAVVADEDDNPPIGHVVVKVGGPPAWQRSATGPRPRSGVKASPHVPWTLRRDGHWARRTWSS